ncbi:unnamed protein product [Sphagnum balticum]
MNAMFSLVSWGRPAQAVHGVGLAGFLIESWAKLGLELLDGGGSEGICAGAADGAIHETVFGGLSMKKEWKTSDQEIYLDRDYLEGVLKRDFQKKHPTRMLNGSDTLLRSS